MGELRKLEATGEYLFHGSVRGDIAQLEPRQAHSRGMKDGVPSVVASEIADPAVFMAVIGSRQIGGWRYDSSDNLEYYLLRAELEAARQEHWQGFVYVLQRDGTGLRRHKKWEWRAEQAVTPQQVIRVSVADLPDNLTLLDDYDQYHAMAESGEG